MTWASFIDFWLMREMGHEDAIFRNYDLLRYTGDGDGSAHLWGALNRIGLPPKHMDDSMNYMPEIAQRLSDYGVPKPDYEQVRIRLIAWYCWDRIRKGDIQKWYISAMVKAQRGT